MSKSVIGVAVLFGMAAVMVAADVAQNLVPDTGFRHTSFESPGFYPRTPDGRPVPTTWVRHRVIRPGDVRLNRDRNSVTMKGGKSFLHSSRFPVKAGQSYSISLKAEGKGKVSIQALWWKRHNNVGRGKGLPVPHKTIALEPLTLDNETKLISAVATASPGADAAYVRVIVEDGTITVSEPSVTASAE